MAFTDSWPSILDVPFSAGLFSLFWATPVLRYTANAMTTQARLIAGLFTATLLFAQAAPPESPVIGVGPFLHIISDLDQSLAFYHDTLGLEVTGPAGGEHKFADNPAVANLYGVPGKQFRAAVLKIPGSAMATAGS